jgi:hypothetical protein
MIKFVSLRLIFKVQVSKVCSRLIHSFASSSDDAYRLYERLSVRSCNERNYRKLKSHFIQTEGYCPQRMRTTDIQGVPKKGYISMLRIHENG